MSRGIEKIISAVFPDCLSLSLTLHHIISDSGCGIADFGMNSLEEGERLRLFRSWTDKQNGRSFNFHDVDLSCKPCNRMLETPSTVASYGKLKSKMSIPYGSKGIKAFARRPRLSLLFRNFLKIPGRHVKSEDIAINNTHGVLLGHISRSFSNDEGKLDFMVNFA